MLLKQAFWAEICLQRDAIGVNMCKELADFAQCILCIVLYFTVEKELVLSQINVVESKLRKRMSAELFNTIWTIWAGVKDKYAMIMRFQKLR